jgi:hypothetical protein
LEAKQEELYTPNRLVCNSAHLIGEAIFMSPVFLCSDSYLASGLSDLFPKHLPCWVRQLDGVRDKPQIGRGK